MSSRDLRQMILDYFEKTYAREGLVFAGRELSKAEIISECGKAGHGSEAVSGELADLCKDGALLDYSPDGSRFVPSEKWVRERQILLDAEGTRKRGQAL